jgi:hypothetical protein
VTGLALQVKDLRVSYGPKRAVDGVSLDINEGATPDGEVPGAGTEKGMRLAVGQIDAILTTTTWP